MTINTNIKDLKISGSGDNKKAILVVSFGTSYEKTRKLTIEKIEDLIRDRYKEYEVRRAFTAHGVIKKLKGIYGIHVDTPEEALDKLKEEGFKEIIVQPLHLIPGEEYDYIKNVVDSFKKQSCFHSIKLGRPVLYFKGEESGIPDDYSIMIEALKLQFSQNETVLFMGHGSHHPGNAVYSSLQLVLRDKGLKNVYIGTIDGYPKLDNVINNLKRQGIKKVKLMPLLLVAGDHAVNDMAGDEEDSWKSILEGEGFEVEIHLHGLGENSKIQKIYLDHVEDTIFDRYSTIGKTKKGVI